MLIADIDADADDIAATSTKRTGLKKRKRRRHREVFVEGMISVKYKPNEIVCLVVIQTSVIPFTPRSGGSDTAQAGKGGSAGKDSGGLSPGVGFPLPHNLLEEQHDAEVVFFVIFFFKLRCFSQVRIRVQGPTPQSSMQSTNMCKYSKQTWKSNKSAMKFCLYFL